MAIGVIAIIFIACYYFFEGHRTGISFLVALFASLGVVYSGYYVAASLREHIHRDKMYRAYEFIKELNSRELVKLRLFIQKDIKSGTEPSDFHKRVLEDQSVHVAVVSLLGLFEDMAIAVQTDYADEIVIFRSLNFLVPWVHESFSPYINQERTELGRSDLFEEFEKVARAWRKNKSVNTGKNINVT